MSILYNITCSHEPTEYLKICVLISFVFDVAVSSSFSRLSTTTSGLPDMAIEGPEIVAVPSPSAVKPGNEATTAIGFPVWAIAVISAGIILAALVLLASAIIIAMCCCKMYALTSYLVFAYSSFKKCLFLDTDCPIGHKYVRIRSLRLKFSMRARCLSFSQKLQFLHNPRN